MTYVPSFHELQQQRDAAHPDREPPPSPPTPLWLQTWSRVARRFFHDAAQPVSYMLAGAQRLQQSNDTVAQWPPRQDPDVEDLRADYPEVVDDIGYGAQQLIDFVSAARAIHPGGEDPGDIVRATSAAVRLCHSVARHAGTEILWNAPEMLPPVALSTDLCANVLVASLLHVCMGLAHQPEGARAVSVRADVIGASVCVAVGAVVPYAADPSDRDYLDRAFYALREAGGRFSSEGADDDRRWVLHFPLAQTGDEGER